MSSEKDPEVYRQDFYYTNASTENSSGFSDLNIKENGSLQLVNYRNVGKIPQKSMIHMQLVDKLLRS